jgi:hypothetical protein
MAKLKNKVCIEVEKGERLYSLICETDSPLGELFDALQNMQQVVVEQTNQMNVSQPKADIVEKPVEEQNNG